MSEVHGSGDDAADHSATERRRRVRAAFDEAIARSPEARAGLLADLDETDPATASELRPLLEAAGASVGPQAEEPANAGAPSTTPPDPLVGRVLGAPDRGWRLESLLGEGGSGRVYRATRVDDGAVAAVKVFSPARTSPAGLTRLQSEIAATRRIEHPGVVAVLEASSDVPSAADPAGEAWITFELVPGACWITEHVLDLPESDVGAVLDLVLAVADAVAAAHAAGVVHRDLKPSNLLVGGDGRPRVIDFGIARILDPHGEGPTLLAERTREGHVLGTPAYMAPEQVDPRLGGVSPRTDVHALGVLAFRLLSGRMPYETGGNLLAAAQAIRHVPPRSLRALAPEVPAAVEAVLMAAMSKEPQGRPADAGDFARRLRAAMDPGSGSAAASGSAPRRIRGATVAAIAMPLLLVLAWLAGRGGPGAAPPGGTPEAAGPTATTPANWDQPLRVAFNEPSRPAAPGGRTLRVPSEHPTIQAAIDAAVDGDLVLIAPGAYRETLQTRGRSIEVRGEGRAAEVVLESPDGGRILTVAGGQPIRTAFRDLSFTGSDRDWAVRQRRTTVIFERCIFRDNPGGGVKNEGRIRGGADGSWYLDCMFLGNGSDHGAGVAVGWQSAVFEGCAFIDNQVIMPPHESGRAAGGGLYYSDWESGEHTLAVRDCIFAGNRAEWGGAIYVEGDLRSPEVQPVATLERTIFYANDAKEGPVAWPWYIRLTVRDSVLCGEGDLIRHQWIDDGGNRFVAPGEGPPYEDADGDLVPDPLQSLLGLPTRVRERIMFEEPSRPAPGGRILRVPGDHERVQAAIDAAADGDLVLIAPGTYRESLRTLGKAIEIRGQGRAAEVVLQSPDGGPVVDGSDSETARPVFRDLTFTGSRTTGAVVFRDAHAVFERCVFRDNMNAGVWLGIFECDGVGRSLFFDCLFLDNSGTEGAGLRVQRRSVVLDGCGFVGNRADLSPEGEWSRGAGAALYYSDYECGRNRSLIRDTVFADNRAQWGAAIYAEGDMVPPEQRPRLEVDATSFFANVAEEGEAAWSYSMRLEVSRSEICSEGELFHNDWIDPGTNLIRPACEQPPYDDRDGDLVPDRLQRLLGVPTRPRDRSVFSMTSSPSGDGQTLRVPGDAESVQAAIDAAADGDVILLAPGEYIERIDPGGRAIEIRGDGRAAEVILRSPDGGPVLEMSSGETSATVFRDLSFTGSIRRPAVELRGAAATFERCIFHGNLAGAARHAASPGVPIGESRYVDCVFRENVAAEGGGLWVDRQSVTLDGCIFVENRAASEAAGEAANGAGGGLGGAIHFRSPESGEAELRLRSCRFEGNIADRGGAIHATGSAAPDGAAPRIRMEMCLFGPNPVAGRVLPPPSPGTVASPSRRPGGGPGDAGEALEATGVDVAVRRSWFCGGQALIQADRLELMRCRFDEQCSRQVHGPDRDYDGIPDRLEQMLGTPIEMDS